MSVSHLQQYKLYRDYYKQRLDQMTSVKVYKRKKTVINSR